MADDEEKRRSAELRQKVIDTVAGIYASGFAEGVAQVATQYNLHDYVETAANGMKPSLRVRVDLVENAVDTYLKMVRTKATSLADAGLKGDELWVKLNDYAGKLADSKAEIINEMEFAQAKLDGAGKVMDEAGESYEWRFNHFDLGTAHEECPICEAIREKSPYSQEAAEAEGFPQYPHPNCDHGWVLVPEGETSETEKLPDKVELPSGERVVPAGRK